MIHDDLVIIDASTVLAGPSVGTYFAELGAKVIKIEHPEHPDVTRSWKLPTEEGDSSISAYFASINYKKEYLSLDLKSDKDHAQFIELISTADILITNFKKGDDIKLNITDDDLLNVNSRLIIGKINGYGSESDRVAYDLILQAETGFMSMNGTPDSGPVKMPVALIDVLSAHHLKEALLLALYERTRTNKGQAISVSLYDAAISSLVNQASNYLMGNHIPERMGSLHPNIAPYGEIFLTADQAQITFAIGSNTHFKKLCKTLNLPELITDSRFENNQDRVINRKKLSDIIQKAVGKLDSIILLSELRLKNVPAGKIKNLKEVFDDEIARQLIREEIIDGKNTKRITSVVSK